MADSQRTKSALRDSIRYSKIRKALTRAELEQGRFENLLEAIGDEVSVIRCDGTITFINKKKRGIFQREGEDLADGNHKCWEVFEKRDKKCRKCPCREARKIRGIYEDKSIHIAYDKNNLPYPIEVTASAIKGPEGNYDEIIEIVRDVSGKKQLERMLDAVYELSGAESMKQHLPEYLTTVCKKVKEVTSAEACSIYLWDQDRGRLLLQESTIEGFNSNREHAPFLSKEDEGHMTWDSFTEAKSYLGSMGMSSTVKGHHKDIYDLYSMLPNKPGNVMVAPLLTLFESMGQNIEDRKKYLGVIEVVNKVIRDRQGYCNEQWGKSYRIDGRGFTKGDLDDLERLAGQAAIWIHNRFLINESKKTIDKLLSLSNAMPYFNGAKTLEELCYLSLLLVTHNDGLAYNQAFVVLPIEGKPDSVRFVCGMGPYNRNAASSIWEAMPSMMEILDLFQENGIPPNALWSKDRFPERQAELSKRSKLFEGVIDAPDGVRIFGHINLKHKDSPNAPLILQLDESSRWLLSTAPRIDEIIVSRISLSGSEIGFLIANNAFDGKRVDSIDRYLLQQYSYSISSAIRRFKTTARFKNVASQTAHEIRGHLQSIMNNSALLTIRGKIGIEEASSQIEHEADIASGTLESFIENVRIESPYWNLVKKEFDLVEVADDAIRSVSAEAKRNNLAIDRIYSSPRIMFTGDVGKIRMVLINLLRNAIQSIPDKVISERKTIRLSIDDSSPVLCVKVEDRGEGIPERELGKVFEPFYGKGHGLGLSLAKQIVENHGGAIRAESKVNERTAITITIPLEAP